ncbi:unnamed protein product [Scytosiphon promiscuus]
MSPRKVVPATAAAACVLVLYHCRAVCALVLLLPVCFRNGMESPGDTNPFGAFAHGASTRSSSTSSAAAAGSARPSAASLRMCNASKRSKVAKKARTSAGSTVRNAPKGLVEKYRSAGEPEWPLRVIVVGHNPSEKAWELGHYYGNPSNRMWKLLSTAGIIPPDFTASNDGDCPITSGVGFTDVGFSIPGTVSSEFGKKELHSWRQGFYDRLIAHAERAAAAVAAVPPSAANAAATRSRTAEITPPPGKGAHEDEAVEATQTATETDTENGYPRVVAFAGKRQWEELFFDASPKTKAQTKGGKAGVFRFGLQPADLRPPGWPFPAERTEMFVLPSSSGAAAMTNEAREGPYRALGEHLSRPGWEWTRRRGGEGMVSPSKEEEEEEEEEEKALPSTRQKR